MGEEWKDLKGGDNEMEDGYEEGKGYKQEWIGAEDQDGRREAHVCAWGVRIRRKPHDSRDNEKGDGYRRWERVKEQEKAKRSGRGRGAP